MNANKNKYTLVKYEPLDTNILSQNYQDLCKNEQRFAVPQPAPPTMI